MIAHLRSKAHRSTTKEKPFMCHYCQKDLETAKGVLMHIEERNYFGRCRAAWSVTRVIFSPSIMGKNFTKPSLAARASLSVAE